MPDEGLVSGLPVASFDGSLSPPARTAITRTLYSVRFAKAAMVCDKPDTSACRDESYISLPDRHCILYPVGAESQPGADQDTSRV